MANKMFYVYNGYFVEHIGDRESCEQYVLNAREIFGITHLTVCVQRNGRYVPAD